MFNLYKVKMLTKLCHKLCHKIFNIIIFDYFPSICYNETISKIDIIKFKLKKKGNKIEKKISD
jgi:hypothetical protein